jgi:hypothetical protein
VAGILSEARHAESDAAAKVVPDAVRRTNLPANFSYLAMDSLYGLLYLCSIGLIRYTDYFLRWASFLGSGSRGSSCPVDRGVAGHHFPRRRAPPEVARTAGCGAAIADSGIEATRAGYRLRPAGSP